MKKGVYAILCTGMVDQVCVDWPETFKKFNFLKLKKKEKKKKLKRTTTVKCVCMKSLVEYIHLMPFKNLLKFRKVKMAKYIYMWENLMQWWEELFTSSQVFFQGKKTIGVQTPSE